MTNTYGIPEHTFGALQRYVEHRLPPGSFLNAMLSADYETARATADPINAQHLFEIELAINKQVPPHIQGSREAVKAWLQGKGPIMVACDPHCPTCGFVHVCNCEGHL